MADARTPAAYAAGGMVLAGLAGQAVSATPAGLPASDVVASAVRPSAPPQLRKLAEPAPGSAAEPVALAGLLDAINTARSRLAASPLAWSASLADEAASIAALAGEKECSRTDVLKVGRQKDATMYWSPGLRTSDGALRLQDLKPSFIGGEWRRWDAGYNPATQTCKRSGDCTDYARLVAPAARFAGCARFVCPNQSQIWTCRVSE